MIKKVILVLVLLQPLFLSAQEIKVNYKDQQVAKVFRQWEQEWGYSIFYSPSIIDTTEKISFQGKGTAAYIVAQVLDKYFFDYTLDGKTLVIKKYQAKVFISSIVKEAESEEDLAYVNMNVRSMGKGTASNGYGYFSLEIPSDSFTLEISCVGYRKKTISYSRRGNYNGTIYLEPYAELAQAVITDSADAQFVFQNQGGFRMNQNTLNQMTGVGNEKDLVRALQMLPGVQKGTDASNGMVVRGGTVDQNLIMLDDAPIYNSAHLLGFFSVFSSDAVKSADLYKSGFSARYGGRLSSVLDVRSREGNRTKFGGHARVGTVASTLSLEGPIKKNSSSFYVTARRSNLDWLPLTAKEEDGGFVPRYYFYDINAKVNIDLGNKRKMYLSLYHGADYIALTQASEYDTVKFGAGWNNMVGTFRLNRIFTDKIFGNLSITYSYYNFENDQNTNLWYPSIDPKRLTSRSRATIEDWSFKYDLDIFTKPKNQMRIGVQAIYHRFLPDYSITTMNDVVTERNSVSNGNLEFAIYQENNFIINKKTILEAGLRLSGVYSYDFFYINPEPRLSLKYQAGKKHHFSFNYDRMAQYVRLLNQSSLGIPVYMWMPSNSDFAPAVSDHLSASYDWKISDNVKLRFEPYYKKIQRHAVFTPNFSIYNLIGGIPPSGVLRTATPVEMQSKGIDLMVEGKLNIFSYRLSYSWGHHQMKNPGLNEGKWFNSPLDRRHDAGAWLNARLSKKWNAGLTWVFSSGNPLSLANSNYLITTDPNMSSGAGPDGSLISSFYYLSDYSELANFRTQNYHRLDLFASYSFGNKKLNQELEFGLYNAYSRMNPFLYVINTDGNSRQVLTQVSVFPIIPSISYQLKW